MEDFKPYFIIDLHGTSYEPGVTIQGTVVLQLTQPRSILGIMIALRGESYVYWTGWENTIRGNGIYQKYSNYRCGSTNKIFDDLGVQLFGNNRTLEHIAAGRHEFPFRFQLPYDVVLPRSFTYDKPTDGSPTGYIKYTLEAFLNQSQNTTYTTQVDIPVNERVGTNLPPLSVSNTKSGCFLCCNFGPVSLSVKTDRGGYCPGNSILISMEVTNHSSQRITAVQATLKQKVIFRGRYDRRGVSNSGFMHRHHYPSHPQLRDSEVYTCKTKTMQMIEDMDIGTSGETYNWTDKPMLIPATDLTLVPTIASCRNIEVSYKLVVSLCIRHARNLSVKLPITIGNTPSNY